MKQKDKKTSEYETSVENLKDSQRYFYRWFKIRLLISLGIFVLSIALAIIFWNFDIFFKIASWTIFAFFLEFFIRFRSLFFETFKLFFKKG